LSSNVIYGSVHLTCASVMGCVVKIVCIIKSLTAIIILVITVINSPSF